MSTIGEVIGWKFNHQAGMSTVDGVITEFPDAPFPSAEDLATWTTEYEAHLAAVAYVDARVSAYPTIGDQLDALWKGGDDQAAMKVIVDKVKTDNPKPE